MSAATPYPHTPGPWRAEKVNKTGDHAVRAENDPNPQLYCTVAVGWGPGAEESTAANARLIAAAPQLLEALREIADWEKYITGHCDCEKPFSEDLFEKMHAALAKAEGRGE